MVLEPVTDLELLDHGGHAHLVLLGEAVQVAEHALVHGCRRRRRRPRKRGELGFGASGRKGRDGRPSHPMWKEAKQICRPAHRGPQLAVFSFLYLKKIKF